MSDNRTAHWNTVYITKQAHEVNWTQPSPTTSLNLISALSLPYYASIIDVGGGDSTLVDHLLDAGYEHITVLDISEAALDRARARLGNRAKRVRWVTADAASFKPEEKYDLWHDRAAFHFLTAAEEIQAYVDTVRAAVTGHIVIGTFSIAGPQKCSGLPITQYSAESLAARFSPDFEAVQCFTEDHTTPFGTKQNFLYCSFRKTLIEGS